jgi:hypothetical protein
MTSRRGQDQVESRSTEDFLQQFGFESLEAAVKNQSPMPAMLCALDFWAYPCG